MRRLVSTISFVLLVLFGYSQNQDLKFGISGSTQLIQNTKFTAAEYKPPNSDFIYQEPSEGAGIINRSHIFNSYSLGAIINYTFKKSTLSLEPQYFMQRSVFRFEKESYSERTVGMKAFRLPIFYSLKFFKKKNSIFFTIGTIWSAAINYDFQHPGGEYLFSDGPIYNGGVDYGDDHFRGILYTGEPYWQNFIGFGKNLGDFKLTVRFISRSKKSKKMIDAEIGQMELNLSYHIIGVSDLKKKRKVYNE